MSTTNATSQHYTQRNLLIAIDRTYSLAEIDPNGLTTKEMASIDEFHVGGRAATEFLANNLGLSADAKVLDIGCGLGGPARYMAEQFGCSVQGVDLTSEYVEAGNALTRRVGLFDKVLLKQADALSLPVRNGTIDIAYMIHVGMNIADKAALFKEVCRVLKKGGRFGIYDIMGSSDAKFEYPMPWAGSSEISFISSVEAYRVAAATVGFQIEQDESRRDFAEAFFEEMRKAGGPPKGPGLGLVMGEDFGKKLSNLANAITSGTLTPWQLTFIK